MKLLIKQYLASLRERNELDAVLPDLLSQLGLNVFSRPGRGTRQDGVDVAAVGSLDNEPEKVYLFSIKAGDLTRNSWDGEATQSLRPSLNEILDAYIPNRLPNEHKDKDVVICLCFGGDIQEQVRPQVEGFIKQSTRSNLTFEEWNGDKLASLILSNFLREDLLPQNARSQLRKSIALLDEPESSYQHFATLVRAFGDESINSDRKLLTTIRQINLCLWVLFAWAREAGNLESAYRSGELALLYTWEMAKKHCDKKNDTSVAIQLAFFSVLDVYRQVTTQFVTAKILPHTMKQHSLSVAVRPYSSVDTNLKLFDVLGRLAVSGIWAYWYLERLSDDRTELHDLLVKQIEIASASVVNLVKNNPVLYLPIKDDQVIDISIAVLLLTLTNKGNSIREWISELVNRARFAYQAHGQYPCNLLSYSDLIEHPQKVSNDYLQQVSAGSVLFPMIALWAALLDDDYLYQLVQSIKEKNLSHCNFQLWYPDESSEDHLYTNKDLHGATLSHVCIERSKGEFLSHIFKECEHSAQFWRLSAVEGDLWPLVLVASRHHRIPVPIHFWEQIYINRDDAASQSSE